jgi:hypothetical protein
MSRFLPMGEDRGKKSLKVRGRGVVCTNLKQSDRVRSGWQEILALSMKRICYLMNFNYSFLPKLYTKLYRKTVYSVQRVFLLGRVNFSS